MLSLGIDDFRARYLATTFWLWNMAMPLAERSRVTAMEAPPHFLKFLSSGIRHVDRDGMAMFHNQNVVAKYLALEIVDAEGEQLRLS